MRIAAAFALAVLAAAAAAAAKPVAEAGDPDRRMYRLQGVGACMADNHPGAKYDLRVDNIFADCECAIDRFMGGREISDLPRIDPGQTRGVLDRLYGQCRTDRLAGASRRREARHADAVPPVSAPATLPPARPDGSSFSAPESPPSDAAEPSGFEPLAWLDRTGVPRLAWIAVPVGLLVLLALLRQRRRHGDLLGPPPWMRPGTRAAPPPKRPGRKP